MVLPLEDRPDKAVMFSRGIGISNALFRQAEEYACTRGSSRTRSVGRGCGMFRALQPSEPPGSAAFWLLGRVQAKGGCRLGESNRNYRDVVLLGGTGRTGWGAAWDQQAIWNRSNGRAGDRGGARADKPRCVRILAITMGSSIGGDELQGAAALRALLDVDLEYPLEQPGPAQAHRRHGRGRLGVVG